MPHKVPAVSVVNSVSFLTLVLLRWNAQQLKLKRNCVFQRLRMHRQTSR